MILSTQAQAVAFKGRWLNMAKERQEHRHLEKRSGVWYIVKMVGGKRIVQSTGATVLDEARKVRDERLAGVVRGTALENIKTRLEGEEEKQAMAEAEKGAVALADGWERFIRHPNATRAAASIPTYRAWFTAFADWAKVHRPHLQKMKDVDSKVAQAYAEHLQGKCSPTTYNRHLFLLAKVWNTLKPSGKFNPWVKDELARIEHVAHSRRDLTVEELVRVSEAAQGEMRLLLALAVYTGLRLKDAALLNWSSVDLVRGAITLVPHKTARKGKRIELPIHPALFAMLSETPSEARTGHVLPETAQRYVAFNGAVSSDVIRLFESCGIETSVKVEGARRNRPECGFHSLRHSFVSLCARSGISQSTVQAWVAHSSPAMTRAYTHTSLETAQDAIRTLPVIGTATAPETVVEGILNTLRGLSREDLKRIAEKANALLAV